ncbi:hypothetical protein MESS2_30006 [Mesorhizobium metallidurans STM 2683]|uniref:Uncharacterized protein n=1 Tax=Mesorhizobium metallidurans STM 2683 TaxID=1297569 RepID=M5EPY3_9HYPH|nr:hypothetical protein MESS2_30006 [Mesorhizobium metallidurans STM 2683]
MGAAGAVDRVNVEWQPEATPYFGRSQAEDARTSNDVSVSRLQHPPGTPFKEALAKWPKVAASRASRQYSDHGLVCIR